MFDNFFNTIRKKIVCYTIVSTVITTAALLFIVIDLNMLAEYLKNNGYRSYLIDREGINQHFLVIFLILCAVIIFSTSFLILAEDIIQYVKEITKGIESIKDGDLSTIIDVKGADELSGLAVNINNMTKEVQKIMERERETERSKNELITSVAHDLRTPLTSIIGYLELLRSNTNLNADTRAKYTVIAYNKSKRLESLINDLFNFTKLNHGTINLNPGIINIIQLLEQLLDEFYPSFNANSLTYEFEHKDRELLIEADGDLVARLFDNLINNAIKYGADGKLIKVCIEREEEFVKIDVINFGKIIPRNELDNIFKKFYRVEQSRSQDTGGIGLGLAIAKNVVSMHGGEIFVTSSLKGTVFCVKLPYSLKEHKEKFIGEI